MSGRKSNLQSYQTITNGNMQTGNITSAVTNIAWLDDIGIQLNFTGSPTGTFQVQVSADYNQDGSSPPNVQNAGHWVPVTLQYWNGTSIVTATSIPATVGSSIYLDLCLLSAPWIRVVYTTASDAGTLNAYITGKPV